MRPEVMFNIRQKAWCLIASRLHHPTVEAHKRLFHELLPSVVIVGLGHLFQENVVAPSLDPNQTQTTRKGFILRHRDIFGGHLVSQTCAFFLTVRHHCFFNVTVDLLLRPIGRADKPIEARYPQ
jgi:hypothetical protein